MAFIVRKMCWDKEQLNVPLCIVHCRQVEPGKLMSAVHRYEEDHSQQFGH
jgi:hypothetical protein